MREKDLLDCGNPEWLESLKDPVRAKLLNKGRPDFDEVLKLFPRPTGEPAFDAKLIAENIKTLSPFPPVSTGHALLDLSVQTGLAMIDAT
ncbi:MAG: hypothetical protein PHP98_11770, partial [Kiritimatiellae bacterium]|nr:hypothetical protein [Kiritimatiellia bacterium]